MRYFQRRWIIWGLAALFYFYEFILRVIPSVIVPELMSAFHVRASALGAMTAFYLYIYAPMQLPVGVLIDRYGARRLITFASAICGIGALVFGFATSLAIADFARLLMGLGSAFAFVGLIFISAHWFPESKRAFLIGLGTSIGMLGGVFGEGPLSIVTNFIGWRGTSIGLGVFGLFIGTLSFLIVKNEPYNPNPGLAKKNKTHILKNLQIVCREKRIWIISLISFCMYSSTSVFAGLWAPTFFEVNYNLSKYSAGFASSMIFVGWLFGGPLIGYFSRHSARKKKLLIFCSVTSGILLLPIVFSRALPIYSLYALLIAIGVVSAAQLLTFSYAINVTGQASKGTASAFVNFATMIGAALFQPLIGIILDWLSTDVSDQGLSAYSADNFTLAMSLFPLLQFIAAILCLFVKNNNGLKDGQKAPLY